MTLTDFTDKLINFCNQKNTDLNQSFEKKNRLTQLWVLAYILCFGIILFLNIITPMMADDFAYLYIFGEKERVGNLTELIRSQTTHYYMWGGRTVVHLIAQILLQLPSLVTDILNSLTYLIFVTFIYLHIKGRNKENKLSIFILINLAVWFIIPMFGDTVLWVTGSANYLWGTTIILAFLLPFRLYTGKEQSGIQQALWSLPALILGIIAGWTNENTAAGMIVICLLFFAYYRSKHWQIRIQYIVALAGVCIGYAFMIKAPGNFARGGEALSLDLYIIAYRLYTYTKHLFLNYGLLLIVYMGAIALYNRFATDKKSCTFTYSFIYFIGALVAIYAMLLSPQFPARAWFGIVTFLIIAIGIFLFSLNCNESLIGQLRNIVAVIASICFLFSFFGATKDIHRIYQMDKKREILAQEAKEKKEEKCYFKRYIPQTTYIHGEDHESNFLLSYYYGIFIEYEKEN